MISGKEGETVRVWGGNRTGVMQVTLLEIALAPKRKLVRPGAASVLLPLLLA